MDQQWYSDLTGAQHLVALFVFLLSGRAVKPSEYAKRVGITRPAVYHQMRQLSQMGVPVVRAKYGHWTLLQFIPKEQTMMPSVPYNGYFNAEYMGA